MALYTSFIIIIIIIIIIIHCFGVVSKYVSDLYSARVSEENQGALGIGDDWKTQFTYIPQRDGRLSWPRWLVTYRDDLAACEKSPIQVLTGPSVN